MRLWLGIATFLLGAALVFATTPALAAHAARRPRWLQRAGLATAALGLAVLASSQSGIAWDISSICFSLIAIVLLVTVLREMVRK